MSFEKFRRRLTRHPHLVAASLLAAMAALLVHAAFAESHTVDEPAHTVRGKAYLDTGDSRLSFAHPPLANLVQGIPGSVVGPKVDYARVRGWAKHPNPALVARDVFRKDYESARAALVGGRLVTGLLTVLLGVYLYRFTLPLGRLRALLTLALYSFLPVFLAHGHLVTTDLPVTVASTVTICEFSRWIRTRRRLHFFTFALAAGVAFATKFSSLILIPTLGGTGLYLALRGLGPWAGRPLPVRLGRLVADFAVVAVIGVLVVNAAYSFQRSGWTVERILAEPEPGTWITRGYEGGLLENESALASLPSWLPIPLPYTWLFGLHSIQAQNSIGHGGWFFGEQRFSPLYFPTLAVIKTPAALLLLVGLAAVLTIRRRRMPPPARLALWVVPISLLVMSLGVGIQIGIRHLLPIFPFVVLAAGWAATHLWRRAPVLAMAAIALVAAEALVAAPHFLGHFSWAIGGSKVGHRISIISEDWGQDIPDLAKFVEARGLQPLYYLPYGSLLPLELARFGVDFERLGCKTKIEEPAWVAIHATNFLRWKHDCGPIRRTDEPVYKVNEHIWIFRFEPRRPARSSGEKPLAPAQLKQRGPSVRP